MMQGRLTRLIFLCCALFWGATASAQDTGSLFPTEEGETASATNEDWEQFATAAEGVMAGPKPSLFRLNRLRNELVTWRDEFADWASINAGRIETVQGQLAALGPSPEEGSDEPASIAQRREALNAQLDELRAPAILTEESYARADGLISEVDTLIRDRDAAALTTRTQSPANPAHWPTAAAAVGLAATNLVTETHNSIRGKLAAGSLLENLPFAFLLFVVAIVLVSRGPNWVIRLQSWIDNSTARGRAVSLFLLSVWEIILPTLGLVALSVALDRLGVLGDSGTVLLDTIFVGAFFIILAHWLNAQFFPAGPMNGPLGYDQGTRRAGRRWGMVLAWLTAVMLFANDFMTLAEPEQISTSVILLPIKIVVGYTLFRFGRLLQRDPVRPEGLDPDIDSPRGRARRFVGALCIFVAIATPVLSILGFASASSALFLPAVMTLAILGVVVLLQRFVNDLWDLRSGEHSDGRGALVPVLIGFVLLLLAMPVLAIIWGARVEDLIEIWTRFSEGFAVGETRISPADFITFASVFIIGYLLTRFIQGTLRTTVMPRTKLDLGGQNAVVAGFGYVGIALAVIIAVTMAGIDLSSLAIVAGALSVGIGFGLQNIVSNFVSGIILLIERPIGEGDWIEVNGTMGYVRDISVRSTRVETFDRTDVIIPNADLVSGQVINWTRGNAVGRVIVPVGVAYGTDTAKVKRILQEVASAHPMVLLNPPPTVLFLEFGDSSLNFEIRAILRDVNFVLSVKSEMNFEIEKRFAEEGIEIPFPQRDLWIKTPDALKGDPDA